MDIGDHDRCDHDDEEVEEPIGASRHSVCLAASAKGVDLGGVEPWERKPCCAEKGNICEKTDARTLCGWALSTVGN